MCVLDPVPVLARRAAGKADQLFDEILRRAAQWRKHEARRASHRLTFIAQL